MEWFLKTLLAGGIVGPLSIVLFTAPVALVSAKFFGQQGNRVQYINALWMRYVLISYACIFTLWVHASGGGFFKWLVAFALHFQPLSNRNRNATPAPYEDGSNSLWILSFIIFFFSESAAEWWYDKMHLHQLSVLLEYTFNF